MNPNLVIDAIEKLILTAKDRDVLDRWQDYATVRVLAEELHEWAKTREQTPGAAVREKILDLMRRMAGLAGFTEGEGFDFDWYVNQALVGVQGLRFYFRDAKES